MNNLEAIIAGFRSWRANPRLLIGASLIGILFSSCLFSQFEHQAGRTAETFDYSTTSVKKVSVTLMDMQNNTVHGVVVEVYKSYPFDGAGQLIDSISPLTKMLTDANGFAESNIDIPTFIEHVYLVTKYPGYANPDTLIVSSNTLSVVIHPAGYDVSLNQSSSKLRMASKVIQGPQEYSISGYSNVWILGSFDNGGLPSYLVKPRDVISSNLKEKIAAALPEFTSLPKTHPEYMTDASKLNLQLIDNCEIWVTFVTEGAGWCNTLGYFYYPTGSAPGTISSINKKIIVFPNTSFGGSGGSMTEGDKVKLQYYDESAKTWTDIFPKGLTVGWFLIADGYSNKTIGSKGQYWDYSIPAFNLGGYQQNIILYDKAEEKMVFSFEDVSRNAKSDEDFNDAVFYATANPITAVATDKLNPIIVSNDKDGDGVNDPDDAYPEDPERAFNKYYPGENSWGMLLFEDLWPKMGDYDFNDFVTQYRYKVVTNASNMIVDIISDFKVLAAGAMLVNGFAFQINTESSNVQSVSGFNALSSRFTLNANGTEAGQLKAVIPVVDDVKLLFGGLSMVNTDPIGNTKDPVDLSMTIHLINPVSEINLGLPPYNPFLIASFDQERGKEIHLSGMNPTDLVNSSYFGTEDDLSDESADKYYVADLGFPWALKLPEITPYPVENVKITNGYLKYTDWVKSSGEVYSDWYLDKVGYRKSEALYK